MVVSPHWKEKETEAQRNKRNFPRLQKNQRVDHEARGTGPPSPAKEESCNNGHLRGSNQAGSHRKLKLLPRSWM